MKIKCPITSDNLMKIRKIQFECKGETTEAKLQKREENTQNKYFSKKIAVPIRYYYYYYSIATFTNITPAFWCRKWGEFGAVVFDLIYITL